MGPFVLELNIIEIQPARPETNSLEYKKEALTKITFKIPRQPLRRPLKFKWDYVIILFILFAICIIPTPYNWSRKVRNRTDLMQIPNDLHINTSLAAKCIVSPVNLYSPYSENILIFVRVESVNELVRDILLKLKDRCSEQPIILKRSDIQFMYLSFVKNHLHIPEVKHKTSKDCAFL